MLKMTTVGVERYYEQSEIDFFLDMAANECQRWLEVTCREIFIDSDDFLYSLRHGSHLRKIVNKIIPDCFDLSPERFKRAPRTTRKTLQNAGLRQTILEKYIEDGDWASQLLLICWLRLHIPRHRLFLPSDLLKLENFSGPYKSFIIQSTFSESVSTTSCSPFILRHSYDSCESDELTVDKCETSESGQIRRLCSTIAFLAGECIRVDRLIPRLDSSAVEPLLQYNDWLVKKHNILPVVLPENPLDFPALDIVSAVTSIVEKVCSDEEKRYRSETFSASSDEGFDTMVECNYAVSKYLADGSSEYSTEDLSSYSAGTKSSRSCSPYIGERCFSGGEQQIPTRPHVKLTSQVAHNPLQFVSSRTTAVALCEQAKQQMIVSEEQRRNRAEALKMMRCSSNVDEEPAWQSNLDSWLSKRKSAISKSRRADAYPTPSRTVPQVSDTRLVMAKLEPRSASTGDYELKEKEEILSVTSSPIADEHTDSGIENNRASSYQHSPSTSSELSPQGDCLHRCDYDVGSTVTREYFVQGIRSVSPDRPPAPPAVGPPEEAELQSAIGSDPRTEQVDTLLQIDNNQLLTSEKTLDDQKTIGRAERKSKSSIAEVDYAHSANEETFGFSRRPITGTVSEIAAKFECSQKSNEPRYRAEKVLPVKHKEHTATFIQKFENNVHQLSPAHAKIYNDEYKAITLGVELCREQTANVTAVKFPTHKQKTGASQSFKESTEVLCKEEEIATNSLEESSSYVPYTTANLAAIKERGSLCQPPKATLPAASNDEPFEPPCIPRNSPSKKLEDAAKRMPSIMTTVEIPFEDVPGAAYQPKNTDHHGGTLPDADGVMVVNIDLGHHTKNPHKYFGFTVAGGKDKETALRIEAVIAGTPADECGLQVGDLILSVNGESVEDRYHQSVIRMLHEAARLGEVELKIKRAAYFVGHAVESVVSPYATMEKKRRGIESISFDEKRSMFDRKSETKDSFMQFRQQRRQQQTSKWSSACGNANKHSGRGGNVGKNVAIQQLVNKFDAITNCVKYGLSPDDSTSRATSARSPSLSPYEDDSNEVESSTRERFNTFGSFGSSTDSAIFESSLQFGSPLNSMRSSPRSNADYRVISMDDKPEPGKLTDFVPEVERAAVIVDQASDNHQEEYKHRETEHDSRCVVSSLSQTDDSQPKLVRNYDITPCRSSAASPSQQNVIDFTKRAEEMTYIPLAKKPPPVPQKPRPPLPPSSALPPEEDEENDDDTQPGRAFVRKQLRQQIGLPQQNDDVYESEHRTMHSASQSGTERGVASAEKLPTIAGIRNLAAAESTNGVRREGDHMLEAQSRVNEHFIQLTSCSWPQSAASSFSGREHRNEPTSAESRNSMIRSQQRGTAAAYPDGDKRVTFGWSETHEITPRQTQEVVVPIVGPPPAQEVYQETTDDANTSSYETVARYGSKPSSNESLHPVEIIHPIHLSNQPNPEKRIFISTADQREQNNATVQRAREKKIWHSGRIPINPKLASSHVVQVRCSSCNSLLDEDALFQQNLDDDSLHVKQFSDESSLSAKPPSSISSDNLRGSEGRRVRCPNSYESVTERFYNSDVHTKYYVSRSLSPQRAKVTVNYETCNRPIAQGLCTSPELLEATDSREWRQIIEQQRLPNAADTNSKNRIDADSKFRIVHSSAGSLKDSLLSSSSWSPSTRSLPPTGIIDASRLNKAGMSGSDSRTPTNATSVLRASVEILHRFPDQLQHQSTESDRPSEFSSYKSGQEQCSSDAKSSEPVVAVSGKHKCSHCQMELGRGAAMIIESLNLFYHLSCFRCYVCNTSLGNGTQGADVRVRDSKLHCQSCYSNDEAGLKFSQV